MPSMPPNRQNQYLEAETINTNEPTTRYFYVGQMMQEEDKTVPAQGGGAPVITGTSYGLGARGVDRIRPFSVSNGTRTNGVRQYPVYDGHGNMILTLARDGTNFAQDNKRTYDVWGSVRSGSGPAIHRYCANLGHVQDPESDLVYMRARYYEPWTGRFISEDPAMDGRNWFVYCGSEPVGRVDPDGRRSSEEWRQLVRIFALAGGIAFTICAWETAAAASGSWTPGAVIHAYSMASWSVATMAVAMVYTSGPLSDNLDLAFAVALVGLMFQGLQKAVAAAAVGSKLPYARAAVMAAIAYSLIVAAFLVADILEHGDFVP